MKNILFTFLFFVLITPSFGANWLKQSTAVTVKLGPFVDSTDGVTAETALTISQADVRLSKNSGDYAQKNESSAATHDEIGEYDVALDATDTNTLGRLRVMVQETGALPVWKEFMVVSANTYDSLVSATDVLDTNPDQIPFCNWGDYEDNDQTIYLYFSTLGTDGIGTTLSGTPDIAIYEDGSTTQIDGGGESLTVDFDSVTGLNQISVDLSNAAYEDGKIYTVMIDAGTVDGVSAIGKVVGVFSVGRYATIADFDQTVLAKPVASGTAQGGTATTIQLAASSSFGDDIPNGLAVFIISGTGAGQGRLITDYVGSTDTATVNFPWVTAPSSDSVYQIIFGPANARPPVNGQ